MSLLQDKEQKKFLHDRELDQIFKGNYEYTQNGKQYSTENFVVLRDNDNNHLIYISDVHSSVRSGEFLKVKVLYEITSNFDPYKVITIKSMGKQTTKETYTVDQKTRNIVYEFENPSRQNNGKCEKTIITKYQISTPAFLPSLLIINNKKIESVGRTKIAYASTENVWRYEDELHETDCYLEAVTIKNSKLNINGKTLYYSLFKMFQNDTGHNLNDDSVEYYMSKHIAIPYMAKFPDNTVIKIKNLSNTETPYKGMF